MKVEIPGGKSVGREKTDVKRLLPPFKHTSSSLGPDIADDDVGEFNTSTNALADSATNYPYNMILMYIKFHILVFSI